MLLLSALFLQLGSSLGADAHIGMDSDEIWAPSQDLSMDYYYMWQQLSDGDWMKHKIAEKMR